MLFKLPFLSTSITLCNRGNICVYVYICICICVSSVSLKKTLHGLPCKADRLNMFAAYHETDLGKLVGDLRFVAAAALGLLETDHHQILKEVLPTDVAVLSGCLVCLHWALRLCRLSVFDSYTKM